MKEKIRKKQIWIPKGKEQMTQGSQDGHDEEKWIKRVLDIFWKEEIKGGK